jgi:tripartite-type tricarboxylate transporter receptor subunit TctC
VIVENKPGANGNTGTDFVAKSPGDGYTLLLCDVGALAITPSVYSKLPFDPKKDLRGVTMLAYSPHLLVVHPSVKANSLKELVALSQTSKLDFAVTAIGSAPHLAGVAVEKARARGGSTSHTRAARRRSATPSPARPRC